MTIRPHLRLSAFYSVTVLASLAGTCLAQSGRTKATPTPTPKKITIEGPSILSTPDPATRPKATPTPRADTEDVIKVESALVPIPVSVLDERGRAIASLRLQDFELKIDGKLADISDISHNEMPIRLAMLFDNSSSENLSRDFEKDAAVRFFKRVVRPDRDQACLYTIADDARREQPFTSNVDLLVRTIRDFPSPAGATAILDGIIDAASYLRSTDGRRVMVIVSDLEDNYSDPRTTMEMVLKSLQVSNVEVFIVNTKEFENYKLTGARGGNANIQALSATRRMQDITRETGGAVYSPINEHEMQDAFDQISAELSQQYILSYYPEDDSGDRGKFREITLSVKGKAGYQVRTRKGYYVPRK
ncbi:MAG: VWA domain-containing protein [Pyrinomonadaceae bacterium]